MPVEIVDSMDETGHDTVDTTPAAKFRARKRRRLDNTPAAGEEEEEEISTVKHVNDQSTDSATTLSSRASNVVRRSTTHRRGGGISFRARPSIQPARPSDQSEMDDSTTDLVPLAITNDRFARASGNIGVVEDTHMTAYIDHKLAAIRGPGGSSSAGAKTTSSEALNPLSASPPPPPTLSTPSQNHIATTAHASTRPTHARAGLDDIEEVQLETLPSQQRQRQRQHSSGEPAPFSGISSLPNSATKIGKTATTEGNKRRRDKTSASRPAEAIARDAMVEDIMREGMVSLYDTPATTTSTSTSTSRPSSKVASGVRAATATAKGSHAGEDKDAAVAEAFQAEFLAEMEERSLRRRQPPAPSNAGGGGGGGAGSKSNNVASGPKLGGSRSMREKMRAATQAQTNSTTTKK